MNGQFGAICTAIYFNLKQFGSSQSHFRVTTYYQKNYPRVWNVVLYNSNNNNHENRRKVEIITPENHTKNPNYKAMQRNCAIFLEP